MGIINVTPDSFSDGGLATTPDAAADRAEALLKEGADVIDVGGESSRPGAVPVDAETELARLLPAVMAIRRRLPQAAISVDTYRATTARTCVEAGADMVNDIEGGLHEAGPEGSPMGAACAALGCPLILMHRRKQADYRDFWEEMLADLRGSLRRVFAEGMRPEQIWTDPGFGFGKTPDQNLMLVRDLSRVAALGHPVLLGTSRKSTLGLVLGRESPHDRHEGNAATAAWGVAQGCSMVRVHDVARILPYLKVADALRAGRAG